MIAAFGSAQTARSENSVPSYTGRFLFVHPGTVWDRGRSMAVMNDGSNTFRAGQELFVLRGDQIIGVFYITSIGSINTYGSFFTHLRELRPTGKDVIAVPIPGELPARLSDTAKAQVLFHTQDPAGRIWAVIDRGLKNGVEVENKAPALFNGRAIGTFKVIFAGRNLSYGILERESIFPENKTGSLIIDFGPSNH